MERNVEVSVDDLLLSIGRKQVRIEALEAAIGNLEQQLAAAQESNRTLASSRNEAPMILQMPQPAEPKPA